MSTISIGLRPLSIQHRSNTNCLLPDDIYEEHEFGTGTGLEDINIKMNDSASHNIPDANATAPVQGGVLGNSG